MHGRKTAAAAAVATAVYHMQFYTVSVREK